MPVTFYSLWVIRLYAMHFLNREWKLESDLIESAFEIPTHPDLVERPCSQ